jgi:hypothetical protein
MRGTLRSGRRAVGAAAAAGDPSINEDRQAECLVGGRSGAGKIHTRTPAAIAVRWAALISPVVSRSWATESVAWYVQAVTS